MDTQQHVPATRGRLNLAAVEASLRRLPSYLAEGQTPRDPIDDRVVENMLAGYAFIADLVAEGIDTFAMGQLRHVLEMNALVLCGTSAERRDLYHRHVDATERRFYEQPGGGIQDLVEWQARHRGDVVWERAAGAYVRVLCTPQLFIEGNHRTGGLLMSYVLLRDGLPPFVLSPESAARYFEVSAAIRRIDRTGPGAFIRLAGPTQQLAALLAATSDPRYLLL